ncbi:hypothetical protein WJT86_01965 [Microvirga sp. W0021]|uniref:Uncharacterized protein n=1 Tax=Hohaiivirga grylli TaxID=3133970 RepID=A0ABV0BI75_9HYPH
MAINKSLEMVLMFVLVGLIAACGNAVGYKVPLIDSVLGTLVIAAIATVGYLISKIPGLHKLPLIFWVSVAAVFAATPLFPLHEQVLALTGKVQFLAVCTPVLALAGLSIGKDIHMFKKISWRIVPVALAVFSGTFLFAAIIAEFSLRWGGSI